MLLRQRDPDGEKLPTDEMEVIARRGQCRSAAGQASIRHL